MAKKYTRALTHVYGLRLFFLKAESPQEAGTTRVRFGRVRLGHRVNRARNAGKNAFFWNNSRNCLPGAFGAARRARRGDRGYVETRRT